MNLAEINPVLVLGAGPAGLAAAAELAGLGFEVVLAEADQAPGGLAARLTCKAVDACAKCGACLVQDLISQAAEDGLIELRTSVTAQDLMPLAGGLSARLTENDGSARLEDFAGLVLAVGGRPARAEALSQYGAGKLKNVITGLDLEETLAQDKMVVRASDGVRPGRAAFIQCVGSRNLRADQPACSQVCCAYALRMAAKMMALDPALEVDFYFMDLQTVGRDMEVLLAKMGPRMKLIRALPGLIAQKEEDGLELNFKPEGETEIRTRTADLVILSVGQAAHPDSSLLARALELQVGEDGYPLEQAGHPVTLAGTAAAPLGVADSIRSGRLAAQRLARTILANLEQEDEQ